MGHSSIAGREGSYNLNLENWVWIQLGEVLVVLSKRSADGSSSRDYTS